MTSVEGDVQSSSGLRSSLDVLNRSSVEAVTIEERDKMESGSGLRGILELLKRSSASCTNR